MAISDFVFDKAQATLQWVNAGRRVQLPASGFEQVQADTLHDRVFALRASAGLPNRLLVFAASGEVLADLSAPETFQFYYLTAYPKLGVAVVCATVAPVDGFRDWHFGLDLSKRELFRHTPAY